MKHTNRPVIQPNISFGSKNSFVSLLLVYTRLHLRTEREMTTTPQDLDTELRVLQSLRGALSGVQLMVQNVEKDLQVMIENYDKHNAVNAKWAKTLQYTPPPSSFTSHNASTENTT
eukprot:Phypoly_transcript_28471.p1 GENE.Phypoly_transcript_28471~~Phypoly_transcript_28471.p1  ORF type:complete len:123 (+),score=19.46 Phypoly_transcript_28471:24-371(+)